MASVGYGGGICDHRVWNYLHVSKCGDDMCEEFREGQI